MLREFQFIFDRFRGTGQSDKPLIWRLPKMRLGKQLTIDLRKQTNNGLKYRDELGGFRLGRIRNLLRVCENGLNLFGRREFRSRKFLLGAGSSNDSGSR